MMGEFALIVAILLFWKMGRWIMDLQYRVTELEKLNYSDNLKED